MAERVFIDWSQPCLAAATEWLVSRTPSDGLVDLRDRVVVVPGRRAGRLLLWHLLNTTKLRSERLIPPQVLTPGAMTAALVRSTQPLADETSRLMAWVHALRASDASTLTQLVAAPPAPSDDTAWLELARMLLRLDDELGGQLVTCQEVIDRVERAELVREGERWHAIQSLLHAQRQFLRDAGLTDPTDALRGRMDDVSVDATREIVLIGVVELTRLQRAVLSRLDERITAIVHVPEALQDHFDSLGCVKTDAWLSRSIDVPEESLLLVDRPRDAAQATLRWIAKSTDIRSTDDVTIALGDESVRDTLALAASHAKVDIHFAAGTPLQQSSPFQLLRTVAAWLDDPSFEHFASLLRIADLERALDGQPGVRDSAVPRWLHLLDRYLNEHLQARLDGTWLGETNDDITELKRVYDAVMKLLSAFSAEARPCNEWVPHILQLLRDVYGDIAVQSSNETDRRLADACRALHAACTSLRAVAQPLQLEVQASTALHMVVGLASDASSPDPPRRNAIEAVGWLELHLDHAPNVVIMHINDGVIPQAVTADAFLNNTLRTQLGLWNNDQRYARDAYLLEAVRASRKNTVLVVGRRDARGEPLAPSRLLLTCQRNQLAHRVQLLTEKSRCRTWELPLGSETPAAESRFVIPEPGGQPVPLDQISVTAFRAYLECPYRFWLRYVKRLETFDDRVRQLDPLRFGNLAHAVLHRFGSDDEAKLLDNAEAIAHFLDDACSKETQLRFGSHPPPAVRIQLARLKQRLHAFAQVQAEHRRAGWTIHTVETEFADSTLLDIPGDTPVKLTGRIDRIDVREKEVLLIDYKTSESGSGPNKTHISNKGWTDLQLPLYHFAYCQNHPNTAVPNDVSLGYITLPKKASAVQVIVADWSADVLTDAVETARQVVRDIRTGVFWPPKIIEPTYDDMKYICQTTAFAAPPPERDDEDDMNAGGDA